MHELRRWKCILQNCLVQPYVTCYMNLFHVHISQVFLLLKTVINFDNHWPNISSDLVLAMNKTPPFISNINEITEGVVRMRLEILFTVFKFDCKEPFPITKSQVRPYQWKYMISIDVINGTLLGTLLQNFKFCVEPKGKSHRKLAVWFWGLINRMNPWTLRMRMECWKNWFFCISPLLLKTEEELRSLNLIF